MGEFGFINIFFKAMAENVIDFTDAFIVRTHLVRVVEDFCKDEMFWDKLLGHPGLYNSATWLRQRIKYKY